MESGSEAQAKASEKSYEGLEGRKKSWSNSHQGEKQKQYLIREA